ncbi:MAG: energy transducer TonB [Proteobacteria bacterium]|nr:energy transducer TonB [Pseudomonadota bacterium]
MLGVRIKIERTPAPEWHDLPRFGRKFILAAIFLSLLVHILSFFSAGHFDSWDRPHEIRQEDKIKIRITDASKKHPKEELKGKKIVETPQIETAPPKESQYVGPQDHSTERETKIAKKQMIENRAQDAGPIGKPETKDRERSKPTPRQIISGPGTLAIPGSSQQPRTNYERLLPSKENDVFGTPTAGYAEYIDARIPDGDRIDMNTTSFRYISYFTGMRKAIEMVWIYPRQALERGLQGEVELELVIEKDGKVSKIRIVNSSGFVVLDENMVQTIKMASPFAPLPKSWNKERILVTGAFHYILSYGAH